MTSVLLLIAVLFIGLLLWLLALYSWRCAKRSERRRHLLVKRFSASTERFATFRRSLLETNRTLQLQLEKSEAAWGDARAEIDVKDKQITAICTHVKKHVTELGDLQVRYNQLVRQYNSLMSKITPDGEMPI